MRYVDERLVKYPNKACARGEKKGYILQICCSHKMLPKQPAAQVKSSALQIEATNAEEIAARSLHVCCSRTLTVQVFTRDIDNLDRLDIHLDRLVTTMLK